MTDDINFSLTIEYTRTIELLRLFLNSLVKIVQSWERFELSDLQYFEVHGEDTLEKSWESNLANITKNVNELQSLRTTLQQRIEMFNNMRNGVGLVKFCLNIALITLS